MTSQISMLHQNTVSSYHCLRICVHVIAVRLLSFRPHLSRQSPHPSRTNRHTTKMHVTALPPRILLSVLRVVGSKYFSADLSQLIICKHWYNVAQIVLVEDVTLHARNVLLFPPESETFCSILKSNLVHLTVRLAGFTEWANSS